MAPWEGRGHKGPELTTLSRPPPQVSHSTPLRECKEDVTLVGTGWLCRQRGWQERQLGAGAILAPPSQPPPLALGGCDADAQGHGGLEGSSCSLWWPNKEGQLPCPEPTASSPA